MSREGKVLAATQYTGTHLTLGAVRSDRGDQAAAAMSWAKLYAFSCVVGSAFTAATDSGSAGIAVVAPVPAPLLTTLGWVSSPGLLSPHPGSSAPVSE
ncbi:hypothetical protein BH23CYA1_BH23CYA1_06520 [soil metagenome]